MKEEIVNPEKALEYMGMHFVSPKKNTANKSFIVRRTEQNRFMLASNCAVCGKKSRFIKNQEASKLLSKIMHQNSIK